MATVLLVDDSPTQRTAVREILVASGLFDTVLEATDGIHAVAILARQRPDIVVCDLEMPRLGGEKLLGMTSAPGLSQVPFLMLTGVREPARRAALLRQGARDVISKPFDPTELVARVSLHLELTRLQRELVLRNELLEKLSAIDSLTQLRNRRSLDDAVAVEWQRSERLGTPFSVLIADLDHFKQINDAHGHQTGDRVLRAVAACFSRRLRATDICGRYGGEEFLFVLNTSTEGAAVAGERWRRDVETLEISVDNGAVIKPTVSFGVASRGEDTRSYEAVIAAADVALYAAKKSGRNRVHAAEMRETDPRRTTASAGRRGRQRRA